MMRPGQVLGLIVAGVILTGAGVWLVGRQGDSGVAQDAQGPVLPLSQADLNTVTGLRIYKGDGSHATLRREAGRWSVVERGYAADSGQVRKLLLDLAALQIEEQKTADPGLYARLGVEDPVGAQATSTGVTVDAGGRQLGLIVGHTSGTRSVFVRVTGQARSVLATPQLAPDADPRHWLDRALLDVAPEEITQVDVAPKDGPAYRIRRGAPGAPEQYVLGPVPKGREVADASALAASAGALAGLQLDDVRKAGTTPGGAHASFLTRDGLLFAVSGSQEAERRFISIVASVPGAGAAAPAVARARDLNARLGGSGIRGAGLPLRHAVQAPGTAAEAAARPVAAPGAARHRPAPAAPPGLPFGPQAGPQGAAPQQSH